jgi:hypothetical protein
MPQSLPVSDFRWLDESEIELIDVQNTAEDCDEDYVIVCDFAYPEHLHNRHSDLPLATEKSAITSDMLSPYSRQLYEHIHGDVDFKPATKLLTTWPPFSETYTIDALSYKCVFSSMTPSIYNQKRIVCLLWNFFSKLRTDIFCTIEISIST